MRFGVIIGLTLQAVAAVEQNWKHTNSLRTIDLSKSYSKESLAVIIENISEISQDKFYVPIEDGVVYSSFEAREKSKSSGATIVLATTKKETDWEVTLPTLIRPGEKITLSISSVRLNQLRPLPHKVDQNGKQYLSYKTSKFIPSRYVSSKQKTKFKLPNGDVATYSAGGDKQGSVVTYGPFENVSPGLSESIALRYEKTAPIPVVTYFERDIEVSHWGGNLAFEERYALTNKGAELKASFDRIAFAQSGFYNPESHAIKNLVFPLPIGSKDAYFTDEIGNVSTSKFRSSFREANLDLKPRYPIFGGWNYTFTVGWNNDLSSFLKKDASKYYLRVPFLEGAENISYDDLRIRVILPEGADNIKVTTNVTGVKIHHDKLWTFMDTKGRSVVSLTTENLTDESGKQDLLIEYEYSNAALFRKPLVVIGVVAIIFLTTVFVGRVL
ncbi:protein of unknown function [Taphrina deformans PYCC 5710]|uniref:Dolichyl-diphosphooligosaccharide--protein glycosyltransferase subunit 1 n=1 Tax=Taphrina deformans (strain PYCC 5710 / ATCC 11124 / CBS 356.35 / IMI 108563 / JCM 9778 / NBRC 8474) TaxID=1097556 RepID=R4XFQ2_TAPDE|nr:protein of unknown function [Taphrina deformans PYCC 5710]|eukprot:CCG84503.1 protein of unknown function [Taphrina deformans PYCC 5710]